MFNGMAALAGRHAAGDFVLITVTKQCGDDPGKWQIAESLGIVWHDKGWSRTRNLQNFCNFDVTSMSSLPMSLPRGPLWYPLPVLPGGDSNSGEISREKSLLPRGPAQMSSGGGSDSGKVKRQNSYDWKELYGYALFYMESRCTISKRPKNRCIVTRFNPKELHEVISVPCNGYHQTPAICPFESWIFLQIPDSVTNDKREWIDNYLESMHWEQISEGGEHLYICPDCAAYVDYIIGVTTEPVDVDVEALEDVPQPLPDTSATSLWKIYVASVDEG